MRTDPIPAVVIVVCWTTLLHLTTIFVWTEAAVTDYDVIEYCQWETFNASCSGSDHVILMLSARYGRMRFGRCMREDHGSVGCSADVITHLDRKCSGKRACQVTVPDATLHNIHPCPKELMPYLEASYTCIRVKTWNGRGCNDRPSIETKQHQQHQQPQQAQPTKSPPGPTTDEAGLLVSTADPFIFSRSGESHGSGSCPWIVEVLPGQRINLTVYNFPVAVDGIPDVVSACALRITIGDRNRTTTVSLCNDGLRHKRLYISDGHKISVHIQPAGNVFVSPKDRGMTGRLLLKYQTFDCADIGPMANAWVRRKDEMTTVKCNFSAETYYLTCRDSKWKGELYNCTDGRMGAFRGSAIYTYGLLAVIGLAVAVGVSCIVVFIFATIVFVRRRNEEKSIDQPTSDPLLSRTPKGVTVDVSSVCRTDHRLRRQPPGSDYAEHPCCRRVENWFEIQNAFNTGLSAGSQVSVGGLSCSGSTPPPNPCCVRSPGASCDAHHHTQAACCNNRDISGLYLAGHGSTSRLDRPVDSASVSDPDGVKASSLDFTVDNPQGFEIKDQSEASLDLIKDFRSHNLESGEVHRVRTNKTECSCPVRFETITPTIHRSSIDRPPNTHRPLVAKTNLFDTGGCETIS